MKTQGLFASVSHKQPSEKTFLLVEKCEFHHDSLCTRSSGGGGIAQIGLFIASINGDKGPRISGVTQENR